MAKMPLPFANGFYVDASRPLSAQECTNWYPQVLEVPGLNSEVLRGTPGLRELATSGVVKQANRGSHVLNGIPYFVNGQNLYRLNRTLVQGVASYDLEDMGTITGTGRVSMADNGTQLCILVPGDPSTGYIFTEDPDTLTTISDTDFKANGEPQFVVFIDGYFAFTTNSKKWIVSELNDGLAYNALDFGTAEADPDDIVAPIVFRNQIFIGGAETMEAFQNIGGAGFPFQRTGLFITKGISAPFSIVDANQTFMFIGAGANESPAIWQFAGSDVQKVSTIPIDTILQAATDAELSEAFAWSYASRGAYFVGFSLQTTTLVYDVISQRWHERKSQLVDDRGVTVTLRSRINSLVSAYGLNIVGDSRDGRVGALDPDVYMEYDNPIVRRFSTMPFQNNMASFLVPSIELTMEAGVGNEDVPDPQVRMDRSIDGGQTWKDERTRAVGKIGEYKRRTIWRRNGRAARFEVFRWTLSDAVTPVVMNLVADMVIE